MAWKEWAVSLLLASSAATAQEDSLFSKASNDSLLWGPYRPNVYFGVRPRLPKSLTTGLLWGRVEDFQSVQHNIRYTCEQHEGMDGYGWDAYDPRTGGVQTVHDKGNGIDMETSFVKFDEGRGGWGARIKGTPRDDAQPAVGSEGGPHQMKTAVWFHAGIEGLGMLEVQDQDSGEELGFDGDVVFTGQGHDLGEFKLTVTEPEGNSHPIHRHPSYQKKPLDRTLVHSSQVPEEALWQAKAILFASMKTTIDQYVDEYTQEAVPPPWQTYTIQSRPTDGNFHLIQKTFEGAFEFDIFYTPANAKTPTHDDMTKAIKAVVKSFDEKYVETLKPQAPFGADKFLRFSKSLFSNLVGGIGYFHGDQMIDRSYAPEYEEENEGFWQETAEARARGQQKLEGPYELYTSIPSRPFFPRGFLWDEGFHLLPIVDWDPELCMQIISSWFNTMDEDGWIPREQILGAEARSKVPPEFQVQYPHYANPPTLFMVLTALLDKVGAKDSEFYTGQQVAGDLAINALASPDGVRSFLRKLYPQLQKNFEWYKKTQSGDLKSYDRPASSSKEAYRWRGRSERHILTSGLDDYPRAQVPHPGELHVDLISWMGMMATNIQRVAEYIGEADDSAHYAKVAEAIRRNIDDLHWDKKARTYCDATIDDYEDTVHVCHKGYISLFPFMTGLMGPEHPHLKDILDLIADDEELWSPHGVRSLSKKDELYGTDENYWRSPVWMNMNYLIVSNLYAIATQEGPHQAQAASTYNELRRNLVETVYNSWLETGFAWEQYNPETGAGQRTQHFTGWTSLVVKIMALPDVGGKAKGGHDEFGGVESKLTWEEIPKLPSVPFAAFAPATDRLTCWPIDSKSRVRWTTALPLRSLFDRDALSSRGRIAGLCSLEAYVTTDSPTLGSHHNSFAIVIMAALATKRKRDSQDMPGVRPPPAISMMGGNDFEQQYFHMEDDGANESMNLADVLAQHSAENGNAIEEAQEDHEAPPEPNQHHQHQHEHEHERSQQHGNEQPQVHHQEQNPSADVGQSASDTAAAAMAHYHTMTIPQTTEQSFLQQTQQQAQQQQNESGDGPESSADPQ
ncbi:glycoside hydrolase, partial [Hortaea werneckii]